MRMDKVAAPFTAYVCLALSMCMVGGNIGIGKLVLSQMPVFLFAAVRFLIAIVVLLPGLLRPAFRQGLNKEAGRGLFLQSFFGCFLFSLFMLYGVTFTSAISAGIITSALPSLIALLACVMLREKISRYGLFAIGFAAFGIALLNLQDVGASGSSSVIGNLLVFGAVLSEALFAIYSRRLSMTVHPWSMAFGVNVVGFLLFAPLAIPQALVFDWGAPSSQLWYWVLFYSVTASVLSFLLWYRGVSQVPANVAGLFTGLMPVSAAVLGVLVLGERLSWGHGVGMAMVIAAILLGAKTPRSLKAA